MYPPMEPYDSGMLDVGEGYRIYWECCGNPAGKPALFLHGGPGSGATPGQRRFFDPSAYRAVLFEPDPGVREAAAREWCAWEEAHVSLTPGHRPSPRFDDPAFRLRFARLVTHYWRHAAFLEEDQLIRDAALLNGTPGVLIHGRYDVSSPLETAWRLSKRWTTSRLQVLDDAGHGGDSLPAAVVGALDQLAVR